MCAINTQPLAGDYFMALISQLKLLAPELSALTIEFKRSARRKTLGLKVRAGEVVVFAPLGVPNAQVLGWLKTKSQWILKHASKPVSKVPKCHTPFTPQCKIFWAGEKCLLADAKRVGINNIDAVFFASTLDEQKKQLLNACAVAAKNDLPARIKHWQQVLGLFPNAIKLRPYKSCWGSCNQKKLVALNTLLMMAPSYVRDYVVVHELCHLKHMNHSPAFWAEVTKAIAQQEVGLAKRWLKVNGEQLLFIYR